MNRTADMNVLLYSFDKCKIGSSWKYSVQKCESEIMLRAYRLKKQIEKGQYAPSESREFALKERGKTRCIRAQSVDDRIVSKAHNATVIVPEMEKRIIYDNGASVKRKGNDFAKRRFETHLRKHYRKRGDNGGYILFADFAKFFDNIDHQLLKEQFRDFTENGEENRLTDLFIDSFARDVSWMTDEEYRNAMNNPFDSLEHGRYKGDGSKMLRKSVNIGSEISQSAGVYFPHVIDNYFKIVLGVKYYGRYMDDIYIIGDTKEELREHRKCLERIVGELKMFISPKKTRIVPINRKFIYLKTKYTLTESGKLYRNVCVESIKRERRRIRKHCRLMSAGRMTEKEVEDGYKSWKGNIKRYNSYRTLKGMDEYFRRTFDNEKRREHGRNKKQNSRAGKQTVSQQLPDRRLQDN